MQELSSSRGIAGTAVYGAVGALLWLLCGAAVVLPPTICAQLVWRGVADGRASWVVVGGIAGALSALMVVSLARRVIARLAGQAP